MSATAIADVVVVGGGCIGLNVASRLRRSLPDLRVLLLDKEQRCGQHASSRNSGVIHAGFYYSPETLKATMTRDGNRALTKFILDRNLFLNQCGKLVVARSDRDLSQLGILYERGRANGVEVEMVSAAEAREIDPLAKTFEKALWSPTTSVADPAQVSIAQIQDARDAGVTVRNGERLMGVARTSCGLRLTTAASGVIETAHLVNAAGLYADQVAHLCGIGEQYTIVPFRGLFLQCAPGRVQLRTNIYPVPDLRQPFLGVHWTLGSGSTAKIGPTSTPAASREHYDGVLVASESVQIVTQLARMLWHGRDGIRNLVWSEARKWTKRGMVAAAADLISLPCSPSDLSASCKWIPPGIRAQLVRRSDTAFVHDFLVEGDRRSTHVLNAVSPAWTCSIPMAEHVVRDHVLPKLNGS